MQLICENLEYSYPRGEAALRGVSLNIAQGDFVGIMGHTGCGKSTLIQLMAGLLRPSSGRVLLDGEDINSRSYDMGRLRRKLGLVFQFPEYQLFETTVERDILFGLKRLPLTAGEKRAAAREAMELMGFDYDKVKDKSPLGFSGGEKRRIAIAGVLAAKPEILVLDEPVAGLDPLGREAFLTLLKKLNREGTTVIMVSHNSDAIAECTRRLVLMSEGRIVSDGESSAVFSDAAALKAAAIKPPATAELREMLSARGVQLSGGSLDYQGFLQELRRLEL